MATPAAILSVLVQADGISRTSRQIKGLDTDLGKAEKSSSKMGGALKTAAKVAGGVVAFEALRRGVGAAVSEFEEARKVTAQTNAVLKSTGGVANVTAKDVARLAGSISKKVGIDDEAIQSGSNLLLTFKNVRNEIGAGNKVFDRATKAAVDLSAAGFGDLSTTSKQLGKALNDPIKGLTALGRSGVTFTEGQKQKIESLVEEGKVLQAQKIILKEVESQVQGSAEAQVTAMDKAKVAVGNFAEAFGGVLAPAIDKIATIATGAIGGLTKLIDAFQSGKAASSGFGQTVGRVFDAIKGAVGGAIGFLRDQFDQHRDDLKNVRGAVRNIGIAVREVWEHVVLPIIKRVLPGIVDIIKGAFKVIGGIIKTASSLIKGDWRAAWDGIKQIFSGAFEAIKGIIRVATAPIRELVAKIADKIKKPFVSAFEAIKDVAEDVFGVFEDIVGVVKDIIKFIGKIKIPDINIPFIGGGEGGGNVGPTPSGVDGFNRIAAGFGNQVTSGFRPGDRGWHGKNRARDYAGGDMLAFAKFMAGAYGSKLLELIHTPLGFGIKNGQTVPLSFWGGDVNADHFDHVHVAFKRGGKVPGSGPGDKIPAMLEAGEFVVRKKIVDKFGPTFFAGLNGMAAGGIAGAVDAARGAGFRGEDLVRAVAIAGAESRYNPKAQNLKYPDHSIGLWQINQLAHKGRFGSDAQLKNPATNAKAAFKLFRESGFRPWSTWPTAAKGFMDRARAAVKASQGKGGGGGGGATDSWGTVGGSTGKSKFGPASTGGGGGGGGDGEDPAQAERDRIASELLAINTQIAQNQLKILALAGQGDQIVGAVVAAVNGGIGGRVGLGFHGIRSTPGSVANL
jgi:hypothetical protein